MGPAAVTYSSRLLRRQHLRVKLGMDGREYWCSVRFITSIHPHATDTTKRTAHEPFTLNHLAPTHTAFSPELTSFAHTDAHLERSGRAPEYLAEGIHPDAQGNSGQSERSMKCMRVRRLKMLEAPHRDELGYLRDLLTQSERYRIAEASDSIRSGAMKNSLRCTTGGDPSLSVCKTHEERQEKCARGEKALTLQRTTQRGQVVFMACCIRCQVNSINDRNERSLTSVSEMGPTAHGHYTSSRYVGVNYALHHCVNRGQTLRGILKGCAEQNAFGAVAASGQPYTAVSHMYLASCLTVGVSPAGPQGAAIARSDHTNSLAALDGVGLPCPECWRHIERVARARREEKLPPMYLYLCVPTEKAALRAMSRARQQISHLKGYIDINFVIE
ncbi:unnamed protein product [Phytomonas sp. EM1]|nr:unnamed protein product [Phytomonas sp. EM1]|eukprot:CCW59701.1 unnamed protein product [Phytomonas sp. isolate EM1]